MKKDKINTIEDNYFIAKLGEVPNSHTIKNMELEKLFNSLNQDLIIEDELEETPPVLKKMLR